MNRRRFLELFAGAAGCFTVSAWTHAAEGAEPSPSLAAPPVRFPQGVASGDPTPATVMLWTRMEPAATGTEVLSGHVEVSEQANFDLIVARRPITAEARCDFTVRVLVTELSADRIYYYRFVSDSGRTSPLGRTRTAPMATADRPVRLAFASCQSYEGGYYHAWRTLLNEDEAAAPAARIDFVLHLGDFVYEALGYGRARQIAGLPSGGGRPPAWATGVHAVTLEDYRFLYRTYLSDPDLQAARARWPFICTWDDHEFSDDSWQSASTYETQPRGDQARKAAANQAWFEFIPASLSEGAGSAGVDTEAHDFRPATVQNAPLGAAIDEHGLNQEPNNLAAIHSLAIYRSFRFGRHVELVVTDTRSYRSEHAVPGELNLQISGSPRYVTPFHVVQLLDAGRTAENGDPPSEIVLGEKRFPNPRRAAPPGTLLGAPQKRWAKEVLRRSDATWKLFGSSIPLQPLRLDLDQVDPNAHELAFTTDSWDGYPTERKELLAFVAEHGISNFVSLTGDHHAHFAGSLAVDFEAADPHWVGAEFAVAGISSESVFEGVLKHTKPDSPLRPLVTFDGRPWGLDDPQVPNLNALFTWGSKAAMTAARTGDLQRAQAVRNPRQNAHLSYCDTRSYGIATVSLTASALTAELIAIAPPLQPAGSRGGEILRRIQFNLPAWSPLNRMPKLAPPIITGTPPYPLG